MPVMYCTDTSTYPENYPDEFHEFLCSVERLDTPYPRACCMLFNGYHISRHTAFLCALMFENSDVGLKVVNRLQPSVVKHFWEFYSTIIGQESTFYLSLAVSLIQHAGRSKLTSSCFYTNRLCTDLFYEEKSSCPETKRNI